MLSTPRANLRSNTKASFIHAYQQNRPVFLSKRIVDDLATPVGIYLRLIHDQPWHFLLESVVPDINLGRYSIIGLDPDAIWTLNKNQSFISEAKSDGFTKPKAQKQPPLKSLKAFVDSVLTPLPPDLPRQSYGVYGYLGYDAVRLLEPTVSDRHSSDSDLPDGIFIRPTTLAIFDRQDAIITICVAMRPQPDRSAEQAWDILNERLAHKVKRLTTPYTDKMKSGIFKDNHQLQFAMSEADFHKMIHRGKEYIQQGDVYQIVLSQKFHQQFPLSSIDYYRALRRVNPSPYLFHFSCSNHALVGSSPEVMVKLEDGDITVRPLAGSRPRGTTVQEDQDLGTSLLTDPKERAEHLMLLDLARNDAGRQAQKDSVTVEKSFTIERFRRIMHISSTVKARAISAAHPVDILLAALPAGTVSGAPKIRAMQRIDEIEPSRRGFYAGTLGYFDSSGNLDSCIALRTAMWRDNTLHFQAGVGVVADSVPEVEYQESLNKLKALGEAVDEALRIHNLSQSSLDDS